MTSPNLPLNSLFHVGLLIQQLNKKSERRSGPSLVQWTLLRHLIDMPATSANNLAKATGVHPSTLTQTLKRLEKKELLFVSEDPLDTRKKMISITRKGRDSLEGAEKEMSRHAQALAELAPVLQRLRKTIQTQLELT